MRTCGKRFSSQICHFWEVSKWISIGNESMYISNTFPLDVGLGQENAEEQKRKCFQPFDVHSDMRAVIRSDGMISVNIAKKCKELAKRCTSIENIREGCKYVLGQDLFYATEFFTVNVAKAARRIENEYNMQADAIRVTENMRKNMHKQAYESCKGTLT